MTHATLPRRSVGRRTAPSEARWSKPEFAEAEGLIIGVLDSLLRHHCLDFYWFSQSDLSAADLLRDGQVDPAAVRDVAALLARLGLSE